MKTINFVFIFFLLLPLTLFAEGSYFFSHISSEQGLSQLTVTSILQDHEGFMWFGTRNGLNKYDGYTFDVYQHDPNNRKSLSDNHILCLTEDNEKNLWIGTNSGLNKLTYTTQEIERFFSLNDSTTLSSSSILSLYTDLEGDVWIGTFSGLNKYNKANHTFERINIDKRTKDQINTIIGKDHMLYLGTTHQGVISYNTKTREVKSITHTEEYKNIRSLFLDKNNNLWIGTYNHGVLVLSPSGEIQARYSTSNGLSSNYIRSINQSPNGNMLIGSFNGLNVLDLQTQKITPYKAEGQLNGSISHNSIYNIFIDKNQTLWIGTYGGGVNYYTPYANKFQFYNFLQEQKKAFGIKGPIVETKNSIYIATEGSGLIEMYKPINQKYQFDFYKISEHFFSHNILKSLYLEGDKIFCGTNLGTIYIFDTQSKKFTLFYDFKSEKAIYQIGRNSFGELYAAGVNEIGFTFFTKEGKIRNSFKTKNQSSFTFKDTRCILEIEKGRYLIGTRNNGLYDFNETTGEIKQYLKTLNSIPERTIPKNYITSIIKDHKGQIWIGTYGGGIALFNREKATFTTYNQTDGLLSNSICALVEDENHHLWISSLSGISKMNLETHEIVNYDYSSGISVNEFTPHSGTQLLNGRVVFSGNNGIIAFNPNQMEVNPHIPPVVLRNLFINNNKIIPGAPDGVLTNEIATQNQITLNHNQTNIAIEYSSLNYVLPNKNQYKYQLKGFDKEWNDAGNRRIAYYTNIPPGTYTFIVKASNNDEVWNDAGTSIEIIVRPPFWKTWWHTHCMSCF